MIRKCIRIIGIQCFFIYLSLIYKLLGINAINKTISSMPIIFASERFVSKILVKFGAKVGKETILKNIYLNNAITEDYSHVIIGNSCYIENGVFFDLVEPVIIEDFCAISAGVMFITHADPGISPLKEYYPRKTGSIRIGSNSWIGARAVILPGISIGEYVVIGAGAVVTKNIPPYSVATGSPAQVIKKLSPQKESNLN